MYEAGDEPLTKWDDPQSSPIGWDSEKKLISTTSRLDNDLQTIKYGYVITVVGQSKAIPTFL